jgi:hypothetical protein
LRLDVIDKQLIISAGSMVGILSIFSNTVWSLIDVPKLQATSISAVFKSQSQKNWWY